MKELKEYIEFKDLCPGNIYMILDDRYVNWNGVKFMVVGSTTKPSSLNELKIEGLNQKAFNVDFTSLTENSLVATTFNFIKIGNRETHPEYFL